MMQGTTMQGTVMQGLQAPGASPLAPARPQQGGYGAGAAFRVAEQPAAAALAPTGAAAPAALFGLLAVQEAQGEAVRDRDARRRAKQMLDELTRLQRALLAGRPDPETLRALAALAGDLSVAADPVLAAAVRAVAVRARVELARLAAAASR